MESERINSEVFISLFPELPIEFLQEFLRKSQNPNEEIENLFTVQDQLIQAKPDYMKKIKCIIPNCSLNNCCFFHGLRDRRRDLNEFLYEPRPCYAYCKEGNWDHRNRCPKGDKCNFAHNSFELTLHPAYKEVKGNFEGFKANAVRREGMENERVENELRVEIEEIEEIIEDKRKRLVKVQYEIEEIRKFAMCFLCGKGLFECALPCGHLLCESCMAKLKDMCSVCKRRFKYPEIVKLSI